MRTTFFKIFCLLTSVMLVLSACNLPANIVTSGPEQPATSTEATVELPDTQTPTETATETPVPEPSDTATPEPPLAKVGRETNCRVGPGGLYDLVATYQAGQLVEVVAKDLGGGYWFVKNPEKPEEQCYLLANNITITGDTSTLPQFTPLPSPLAPPFFNVSFKKFEKCNGRDYAVFIVENTGSVPFRSFYVRVTGKKNEKSVDQVLNAFDLRVKCTLIKIINPLNSGETGYVNSPQFEWQVTQNKLVAVIMLCTEKDLKGSCVTQSLDVK
ncbi:MAG: hypothetical protein K8S20_14635 [Chloroflexi bacterium]|nr:hypothetical protein [Chloroflexota bacterium]